jgi:hypothetical protein
LSEGVTEPETALGEYVVTPQLVARFDLARDFIFFIPSALCVIIA